MSRLAAGRIIADKYRLEHALAAGGMGSVWRAWNTQLDVPVAIKFMAAPLAASNELVARFEREARAAAQIRSPHVVQIFEHGVDGELPFIVMELLEGEDLGALMRRVGKLSLDETSRVVASVCRALRRAHAMGIVHRDLKPGNIFLARSGDDEDEVVVKVLDFGVVKSLAEAVDSGVTKTGELVGTPHYMSPEQARNTKRVDHRSDLWSLGVITYRALTASLPFPDDEGLDRLMRICSEPIPPPSTIDPDLSPEVDAFFGQALAIDPDFRFQSAREMSDAIRALAGEPASHRTGSRPALGSIADGPPSSAMYTAQAYVYTSASPETGRSSPSPRDPVATERDAAMRAPTVRHGSVAKAPLFPFAADRRDEDRSPDSDLERATEPPPATRAPELPTRISKVHAPLSLSQPSWPKPTVAVVTAPLADVSGPLPSLQPGDLDTLDSAGLSRSGAAVRLAHRSRLALGFGVSALAVGALASFLYLRTPAVGAGARDGNGTPKLLFTTTTAPLSAVTTVAPLAGVTGVEPTAAASSAEAPSVSAPPAAAPASAVRAAEEAPGGRAAAASTSQKGPSSASARATASPRPRPSSRPEGGIGRPPTY